MQYKKAGLLLVLLLFFVSACSAQNTDDTSSGDPSDEFLETLGFLLGTQLGRFILIFILLFAIIQSGIGIALEQAKINANNRNIKILRICITVIILFATFFVGVEDESNKSAGERVLEKASEIFSYALDLIAIIAGLLVFANVRKRVADKESAGTWVKLLPYVLGFITYSFVVGIAVHGNESLARETILPTSVIGVIIWGAILCAGASAAIKGWGEFSRSEYVDTGIRQAKEKKANYKKYVKLFRKKIKLWKKLEQNHDSKTLQKIVQTIKKQQKIASNFKLDQVTLASQPTIRAEECRTINQALKFQIEEFDEVSGNWNTETRQEKTDIIKLLQSEREFIQQKIENSDKELRKAKAIFEWNKVRAEINEKYPNQTYQVERIELIEGLQKEQKQECKRIIQECNELIEAMNEAEAHILEYLEEQREKVDQLTIEFPQITQGYITKRTETRLENKFEAVKEIIEHIQNHTEVTLVGDKYRDIYKNILAKITKSKKEKQSSIKKLLRQKTPINSNQIPTLITAAQKLDKKSTENWSVEWINFLFHIRNGNSPYEQDYKEIINLYLNHSEYNLLDKELELAILLKKYRENKDQRYNKIIGAISALGQTKRNNGELNEKQTNVMKLLLYGLTNKTAPQIEQLEQILNINIEETIENRLLELTENNSSFLKLETDTFEPFYDTETKEGALALKEFQKTDKSNKSKTTKNNEYNEIITKYNLDKSQRPIKEYVNTKIRKRLSNHPNQEEAQAPQVNPSP